MTVPASILQMLETHNIVYQLKASQTRIAQVRNAASPALQPVCVVKSIILQDGQGRVQVLLPADRLIDIEALKQQFGRDLRGLPSQDLQLIMSQHKLKSIPAFPEWQGLPTLVDSYLLQLETLLLETGDNEQLVELRRKDFHGLIKNVSTGEFTVSAPVLPASSAEDADRIVQSLKTFTQLRIKQRLQDTLELSPLPETAHRIIRLRADSTADISDLTNIVELDPPLASQVVSWAASPYYSAPGKIKSVHDAIVRVLGFDMVLNLALGLALGKALNTEVINARQLKSYWQQAVCTAAAIEGLVTSIAREHRPAFGMAYLSGLLNNFGYLILAEVFPPYFTKINRHYEVNPHLSNAVVEQHVVGVANCQIAAWLMENWGMPAEIITALRHQNNPDYEGEHHIYAKLIYVARQLLVNNGIGHGVYTPIPTKLYEALHLDPETAALTIENILESADDLDAIAEKIQG